MNEDVFVRIFARCRKCKSSINKFVWLPRRRWKEFARTEVVICKPCNFVCSIENVFELNCFLSLVDNKLILTIGTDSYTLLENNKNNFKLHLGRLPKEFREHFIFLLGSSKILDCSFDENNKIVFNPPLGVISE